MRPAARPPAILFDLDGTLVDTVPFILAAVRHAFEGYGACPTDAEWIAGIGTPLRTQLASFARRPEDVEALFQRYRGFWLEHHDRETRCFPGALEVVAALSRAGHPIGIVTAKIEQGAYRTLRHTGLLDHVQAIVGADSCANAKPHPEPVLLALARLGVSPAEAILVGDSPHDIVAAKAAGATAIGATWGACARDALAAAGADHLLDDIEELPPLVARAWPPAREPAWTGSRTSRPAPPRDRHGGMRIAYLGPPGTFSEEAVARCDLARGDEPAPFPTFADAYHALRRGEVDGALLPIENSIEGSVGATLDLLVAEPGPLIRRELLLPVRQHLLARAGTRLEDVRRVLSHPQPFGQCSRFLRERLPGVALEATHSTADAARKVAAGEEGAAAIGARAAASRYGLSLLAESIQDVDENVTRFVLLAQADEAPTGQDRTSVAFTLDRDRPGGLYEVLGEFARRGINLSKVQSRPMKEALGHYVFFLDFEAHRLEPDAADALSGVRARVHRLFLLGSYPRATPPT